jgi:hypothetical protein
MLLIGTIVALSNLPRRAKQVGKSIVRWRRPSIPFEGSVSLWLSEWKPMTESFVGSHLFARMPRRGELGDERFADLAEQEILALAISNEEEDDRIYRAFAQGLRERYPASAKVFDEMADEEVRHRSMLFDLYRSKFGDDLPLICRQDVKGFLRHKPLWLVRPLGSLCTRRCQNCFISIGGISIGGSTSFRLAKRTYNRPTARGTTVIMSDVATRSGTLMKCGKRSRMRRSRLSSDMRRSNISWLRPSCVTTACSAARNWSSVMS